MTYSDRLNKLEKEFKELNDRLNGIEKRLSNMDARVQDAYYSLEEAKEFLKEASEK